MKIIIKVLRFILVLGICIQCKKNPMVPLKDENFLKVLINIGADKNGDGNISFAEAEVITDLCLNEASVSDMSGIEAFVNLKILRCGWNKVTNLDVSNIHGLTVLECPNNELTSLDVHIILP